MLIFRRSWLHITRPEFLQIGFVVLTMCLLGSIFPLLLSSTYKGSPDIHATLEMAGALLGMLAGTVLVVHFYALGNRFYLLVGLAYFINGTEDFVHGLISFRNIFSIAPEYLTLAIPSTYVTGRILMAIILIFAPFVTTWFGESQHPKRETVWVSLGAIVASIIATNWAFHLSLPQTIHPEAVIPRPLDFLSAILLCVSLVAFIRMYHRERNILAWWVLLSIGVNIVGQLIMSFSRSIYDPFFDIAHVYKLFGYMTPVFGFSLHQIATITQNRKAAAQVIEEVRKNREKDGVMLHQDKLAAIGQLAAGVAHEINNPMGFIMSNLSTLKKYGDAGQKYLNALEEALEVCCPEERRKELEELRKELDIPFIQNDLSSLISESQEGAERVKQIVHDLKDFARIDEDNMTETDLNRCVQSTANIVRNEIKYVADLELQLNEIPSIVCNSRQINQVIANLLVNAGQAMDKHGTITVTSRQEGDEVLLSIRDTGRGMTEAIRKRIFEPFFTTKAIGKGTGLGLSITYDIIKKHGGAITLESELGKGTTFTIRLPIKRT